MENDNRNYKGLVIAVVILLLLVIGLAGYICYDKLSSNNNAVTKEETETIEDNKESGETTENTNVIETRICTGVYSGTVALAKNIQTDQYEKGILTLELKSDGTYELKKENVNGDAGSYTIIENTLLLKTAPHTCPPEANCSAEYTQYLHISSDCSTISSGYGSHFFDPSFELKK